MSQLIIYIGLLSLCFYGCNSVIVTHTQGAASDVVDSAPKIEAQVEAKPELSLKK